MPTLKKIWDFLGSRNLSVFVFIAALTYILFLAVFGAIIPVWWVNNISGLLPFKIMFVFFFINLIICEIKWMPVIFKRCRKPIVPKGPDCFKRFGVKREVAGTAAGLLKLARYLKRRGYKVESRKIKVGAGQPDEKNDSSSIFYACRGRFSPIGNFLFHSSYLFILAGVFVSLNYRVSHQVLIMEGQDFRGASQQFSPKYRESPLSDVNFMVDQIRPEFWKGELLFTYLGALLKFDGGDGVAKLSSGVGIGGARVTIAGVSYTPRYVFRELDGNFSDVGHVNLANFVPGSVDKFQIPGFPYKIYVSIYPDIENREGKVETRSMNLSNPGLFVKVVRGKLPVFSGVIAPGDEAFFDGYGLTFPEIKYNGIFLIVKDQGEWLIWMAFILMVSGLVWNLLFYKREVAVTILGDKIYLYLNSNYYPSLFFKKITTILET